MAGATAGERERWACVCDMIYEEALSLRGAMVPTQLFATLANRLRNNDGPQLPPLAHMGIVDAARAAVRAGR